MLVARPSPAALPRLAASLALWAGLGTATAAQAAPGQGLRLGGVESQGPASRAVTALYHNPAMLAALPGTAVHASIGMGVLQQRVQRNAIDPASGDPQGSFGSPVWMRNSGVSYFTGASFYFDPIAVGIGLYDLGSRYQLRSPPPLRYHLAPDPDPGCLQLGLDRCPPNGGSVSYQQDLTMALAWNGGAVKLGAGLHLPIVRERFAFDNDTELSADGSSTISCDDKEDPACAERVGFKGWTQWIPRNGAPSGFDFAITVGAAVGLANDTITLGARYRSPALRRRGELVLAGVGLVCRPEADAGEAEASDTVPACDIAEPVGATLRQSMPQQLALGGSFLLGRSRLWRLDLDLYWMDLCPGGLRASECPSNGDQTIRLIGLDRDSFVLPEFTRFRGTADLYGIDAYLRYFAKRNLWVLGGAHLASPSVRRGATTAALDEGWRLGTSAGVRLRMRRTDLVVVPGYGLDLFLPRTVTPGGALFSPAAAIAFDSGSGDINAPGANEVLQGRGRPTNAARYFGMLHTLSFAVMWGERLVLD